MVYHGIAINESDSFIFKTKYTRRRDGKVETFTAYVVSINGGCDKRGGFEYHYPKKTTMASLKRANPEFLNLQVVVMPSINLKGISVAKCEEHKSVILRSFGFKSETADVVIEAASEEEQAEDVAVEPDNAIYTVESERPTLQARIARREQDLQPMKYMDYRATDCSWRFDWKLPLPWSLWSATCPITNQEIHESTPPTEIQQHYADFKYHEPQINARIWIEEPMDGLDVPLENKKLYEFVRGDFFKSCWANVPVCLRINDGDDSYAKKEYPNLPFGEAMRQAQEDAATLRLATSYEELIDTAYNALGFEHDN